MAHRANQKTHKAMKAKNKQGVSGKRKVKKSQKLLEA
jgi:hypothetical protein